MQKTIKDREIKKLREEYNSLLPELLLLIDSIDELTDRKLKLQKKLRELDTEINHKANIWKQ